MIKIKNNILIYFIFYINNISFLTKTEKQLQDYNNEDNNNQERNSEQKNENITPEKDKNEIKKYKNILFLILFRIILIFILLFGIYKIFKKIFKIWSKYKKNKENKENEENKNLEKVLTEDLIKKDINNLDFFITNTGTIFFKMNQNFIDYFIDNFIDKIIYIEIFLNGNNLSSFSDSINNIEKTINNFKKINQKKPFVIYMPESDNYDDKSISSFTCNEMGNNYQHKNNYLQFKISLEGKYNIKEILDKYCEKKTNP